MRRFWIGVAALAVLLFVSLWVTDTMEDIHAPIASALEEAGDAAMDGDWPRAEELATDARSRWFRHWRFTAAVADHAPMDEVDGLFAQLPVFAKEEEAVHFAATCAQLAKLVGAMEEAHGTGWWNLL